MESAPLQVIMFICFTHFYFTFSTINPLLGCPKKHFLGIFGQLTFAPIPLGWDVMLTKFQANPSTFRGCGQIHILARPLALAWPEKLFWEFFRFKIAQFSSKSKTLAEIECLSIKDRFTTNLQKKMYFLFFIKNVNFGYLLGVFFVGTAYPAIPKTDGRIRQSLL